MRDTCSQETIGIEEAISLVQSEFYTGNMSGIPIGVIGAASSSVSVPIASFLRVFNINKSATPLQVLCLVIQTDTITSSGP